MGNLISRSQNILVCYSIYTLCVADQPSLVIVLTYMKGEFTVNLDPSEQEFHMSQLNVPLGTCVLTTDIFNELSSIIHPLFVPA